MSIAISSAHISQDAKGLVERGHFSGRKGKNVHISGRLQKAKLFSDTSLLDRLIGHMQPMVEDMDPTVLVGQEKSAAIVARHLGILMCVPVITLEKHGTSELLGPADNTDRTVVIEDNFVTGRNLGLALSSLRKAGIEPVGLVSLLNSSGCKPTEYSEIPLSTVIDLGIQEWDAQNCEICDVHGVESLDLSTKELAAHES
ncbi:hypothetical protein A3D14_00480 [Candidatus Saccharibacteria bacterium RIFCSPHIGHO2_02_FULL_47_12]|nr:MAG: hypothetical protein A3D14_00480 [Candidatus Saccharibacteria bacterium RIFCSPHIGHO2_02_FULL_47_12]